MRILLGEEHPFLGRRLKKALEKRHYAVDLLTNGKDAYALGSTISYDLIVLNVMLPDLDGFEVCQRLRAAGRVMPILFLAPLNLVDDRVKGLNLGGDDSLSHPFAFGEFQARVRALLRRQGRVKTSTLRFMDISLDTTTSLVQRGTRHIELGHKEFALLEYLLHHPHEIITRAALVEHIWALDTRHRSNVIEVYIWKLRSKLCARGEVDVIQTVRGVGYVLKEPQF